MPANLLPTWVTDYIGAPYEPHGRGPGYDCLSLIQTIHCRHFGWEWDDPERGAVTDPEDVTQTGPAFDHAKTRFAQVSDPCLGDVVLLRVGHLPAHVGLYLGGHRMLHVLKDAHACIEPIDGLAWGNRVLGFYRFN